MKLSPFNDRILARPDFDHKPSNDLIVLIEPLDSHARAVVLAVGPGKKNKQGFNTPGELKRDDKILFHPDVAKEVMIDGLPFLVMKESDVLAVIDE